jgi:hypothetical protein
MITPPEVVDTTETVVDGEPPMINPQTGQIVIPQSPGDDTLQISTPVICPDGDTPTSVIATLTKSPSSGQAAPTIQINLTKGAGNVWSGTFNLPPDQADATIWDLNYTVVCPDDGTIIVPVGQVILIDPSGFITDAVTGDPIEGATVFLQRFDNGVWHNVDPAERVNGFATFQPAVNPLLTNSEGHYAWDVIEGKYRVVVTAPGYIGQTSPEVDIPPPVLDLNLQLQPIGSGGTPTPTQPPQGTPTPTQPPAGTQYTWGDVNCSGAVDPVDSLLVLRDDAGLSSNTGSCPAIGASIDLILAALRTWGDFDCSGPPPNPIDALKTLRFNAGESYQKADPSCPNGGAAVKTPGGSTPTQPPPTPTPTQAPPTPTPTQAVTATPTQSPSATPTLSPTQGGIEGIKLCWIAIFANDIINGFVSLETCSGAQGNSYECTNPPQNFELSCTTQNNAADYFCDGDLEPSPCSSDGTAGYPDYLCSFAGGAPATESCNTSDPAWPDYVCTATNPAAVNCQTAHPNHPDFICLVNGTHYSCN